MVMEIAAIGDFTAIANCTDVRTKIPTAGIACKMLDITVLSCGGITSVRR